MSKKHGGFIANSIPKKMAKDNLLPKSMEKIQKEGQNPKNWQKVPC